jgi:hypothetical protein
MGVLLSPLALAEGLRLKAIFLQGTENKALRLLLVELQQIT